MGFDKVGQKRTICEVMREIHDITDKDNIEVISRLEEMKVMARKMDAKLKEYKKNWQEDFYKKNTDVEEKTRIRQQ